MVADIKKVRDSICAMKSGVFTACWDGFEFWFPPFRQKRSEKDGHGVLWLDEQRMQTARQND